MPVCGFVVGVVMDHVVMGWRLGAVWMALVVAGCGGIETTEDADNVPDGEAPDEGPTGVELAALGFGEDPYEIGATWYHYDNITHTLSARSVVYAVERGQDVTFVRVENYYNAQGVSGFFSLQARTAGAEVESLTLSNSVKETEVCVSLSPLAEVACADPKAALVLRTSWRVVPEAGFAVSNPGLFNTAHFAQPEGERQTITSLDAEDLGDEQGLLTLLAAAKPNPSAASERRHARFGSIFTDGGQLHSDIHIQATAGMQAVQWQLSQVVEGQGAVELSFNVLCAPLAMSPTLQEAFEPGQDTLQKVSIETSSPYSVSLVRFCDPDTHQSAMSVEASAAEPFAGLWPDERSFDLMIEQFAGDVSIRLSPGNLMWNWTRGDEGGSQQFVPLVLPESLWE